MIINALHYHHIDLGRDNQSIGVDHETQANHIYLIGLQLICPAHLAYSSLTNYTVFFENPFKEYKKNCEFFKNILIPSFPSKQLITDYSLRAPPISFFS